MIPDRATFDFYSDRNNFPGAMQVPEVKFTITGVDTPTPRLYFMNTKNYPYHYDFVVECLGWQIDLETFNRETYFSDHRKNLAGSIIAHDHYEPNEAVRGIYTMEFWPTDPVTFPFVRLAYDLILAQHAFREGPALLSRPGRNPAGLVRVGEGPLRRLLRGRDPDGGPLRTDQLYALDDGPGLRATEDHRGPGDGVRPRHRGLPARCRTR